MSIERGYNYRGYIAQSILKNKWKGRGRKKKAADEEKDDTFIYEAGELLARARVAVNLAF